MESVLARIVAALGALYNKADSPKDSPGLYVFRYVGGSPALKTVYFKKGDIIIKQYDKGDVFYFLDEGRCHAEKIFEEGKPAQSVKDYQPCDYFG